MAQWTETLEPYVKVQEEVKTVALNPTTGEDLIIGCVIFADAGPSVPTLIRGQKEFRETYSSQDLTEKYLETFKDLYDGDNGSLPATMWSNAYRLAGSNTLLVVRAGKSKGLNFIKPLSATDANSTYIIKDGAILKKVDPFKLSINVAKKQANNTENNSNSEWTWLANNSDGWAIAVNGVGVLGNRVEDAGPKYDILVNNLPELVSTLNESSVFFSPDYTFFKDVDAVTEEEALYNSNSSNVGVDANRQKASIVLTGDEAQGAQSVVFNEVYVAADLIDTTQLVNGFSYIVACDPKYIVSKQATGLLIGANNSSDSFNKARADFEEPEYYTVNNYNAASDLRVRIRRFNHDAVTPNSISTQTVLTENSPSMYTPIEGVLKTFYTAPDANGNVVTDYNQDVKNQTILDRDFYEVAVYDPSLSAEVLYFNIGNLPGRGDMTVDEFNKQMQMIGFNLPKDMSKLDLNYAIFKEDDVNKKGGSSTGYGLDCIFCDLKIDPTSSKILKASDTDLLNAIDLLELDEVYVTEGLSDLGNTNPAFQSYLANLAINKNYFYPISTVNSTNYMTIGNSISKISQNSYKLYASAPWDLDSSTLGWENFISPSVLYWEAVARNRRNNEEFRGVFGQGGGLIQYQSPVCEFNKKTRQLLLTKRVNTATWDIQTNSYNMNDNYTKQNENTIMSDEGNSRLMIRISKACPVLLKQFIGRKITDRLCNDIYEALQYYFKTVILAYAYTVDDYQIFCDYDEALARQNKVKVVINVRYSRSLKYINVINRAFDVGMDISNSEE